MNKYLIILLSSLSINAFSHDETTQRQKLSIRDLKEIEARKIAELKYKENKIKFEQENNKRTQSPIDKQESPNQIEEKIKSVPK